MAERLPATGAAVASWVRPYTVTGGRTRAAGEPLPMESLVEATAPATASRSVEGRQILTECATQYSSVAELAAHLHLPLGVVRVLVDDLVQADQVRVHRPATGGTDPSLRLLESVLDGIAAL